MRPSSAVATNVIRFPGPRAGSGRSDGRGLLDTVYTSGSLMVAAEDRETKAMASRLHVFGFLNITEIGPGGQTRRLRASEVAGLSTTLPWRLSRPSFDELPPLAG